MAVPKAYKGCMEPTWAPHGLKTVTPSNSRRRCNGSYHPYRVGDAPGGRQWGQWHHRCRDAHDTTSCLDNIKRRLVIRRWLPCTDEGDGPLSRRSRPTGHNGETMPERDQPPPERLAHPTSTNKRNVIARSDRLHTVSPGREPTPKRHIMHGRRARGKPISRWPGSCSFSMTHLAAGSFCAWTHAVV
jgi:hypothetical protein